MEKLEGKVNGEMHREYYAYLLIWEKWNILIGKLQMFIERVQRVVQLICQFLPSLFTYDEI